MKLALGSVQFGRPYGVKNDPQPTFDQVSEILSLAKNLNVRKIDTANAYGDSEEILGTLRAASNFEIVSKISSKMSVASASIERAYCDTVRRLRCDHLYGLLLHRSSDWTPNNVESLERLKTQGHVEKVGISVYTWEEIEKALLVAKPDLIQLPINAWDQRLTGHLAYLAKHNIEVHARSVFLQGLLLMEPSSVSSFFAPLLHHINRWHQFAVSRKVSKQALALGFVCQFPEINSIVIGVNSCDQLRENAAAFEQASQLADEPYQQWAVQEPLWITPTLWSLASNSRGPV